MCIYKFRISVHYESVSIFYEYFIFVYFMIKFSFLYRMEETPNPICFFWIRCVKLMSVSIWHIMFIKF